MREMIELYFAETANCLGFVLRKGKIYTYKSISKSTMDMYHGNTTTFFEITLDELQLEKNAQKSTTILSPCFL